MLLAEKNPMQAEMTAIKPSTPLTRTPEHVRHTFSVLCIRATAWSRDEKIKKLVLSILDDKLKHEDPAMRLNGLDELKNLVYTVRGGILKPRTVKSPDSKTPVPATFLPPPALISALDAFTPFTSDAVESNILFILRDAPRPQDLARALVCQFLPVGRFSEASAYIMTEEAMPGKTSLLLRALRETTIKAPSSDPFEVALELVTHYAGGKNTTEHPSVESVLAQDAERKSRIVARKPPDKSISG